MTNSLVNLPQELLLQIIDHVQDANSLFKMLQCCRFIHGLTLPYLYRNVEIRQARHVNPTLRFHTLYNFTCQILHSRERALLVQRLTFREVYAYAPSKLGDGTTGQVSHEKIDENLRKAVCRARFSKCDELGWLRDLQSNNPVDALLAVLLPHLPYLQYLNMAFPYSQRYYSRMLMSIVTRPGRVLPETAFEQLQHVVIPFSDRAGDHRGTGIWPHQLAYLLRVPSLQSVSAHVCYDIESSLQFEDDIQDTAKASWDGERLESSKVSSLALEGFRLRASDVEHAVTMCNNLKSLKLNWICERKTNLEMANLQISGIPKAIMPASQTLESLSLTYTFEDAAAEEHADSLAHLHGRISLTDYPKLRTLTLGVAWIFGLLFSNRSSDIVNASCELLIQLLPSTIETLRVEREEFEDAAPVLPNIEAVLLEKQSGYFGGLKSITVLDKRPGMSFDGNLQGSYPSTDLPREVSNLATSLGVDFKWIILDSKLEDEEKELLEELKQSEPYESYFENNAWPGES